jgi:hypothetical protein
MSFWRFPPPPTQRLSTRLAGAVCSFCGSDEDVSGQFWTGRIIRIQHKRKTICESCVEWADEQAECARLARRPLKAKRGPFRHVNRRSIGA